MEVGAVGEEAEKELLRKLRSSPTLLRPGLAMSQLSGVYLETRVEMMALGVGRWCEDVKREWRELGLSSAVALLGTGGLGGEFERLGLAVAWLEGAAVEPDWSILNLFLDQIRWERLTLDEAKEALRWNLPKLLGEEISERIRLSLTLRSLPNAERILQPLRPQPSLPQPQLQSQSLGGQPSLSNNSNNPSTSSIAAASFSNSYII